MMWASTPIPDIRVARCFSPFGSSPTFLEVNVDYTLWFSFLAQAQGKGGGSQIPGCAGGGITQLIPMVLIFVVFYFLLIRPQQKKAKEPREMLDNLHRDDLIITSGGILGRITGLAERPVTIEVAEKIRLRV